MKTSQQQLSSTALFTVTVLALLTSTIHADYIYVSCAESGIIEKFDLSGNRTILASGRNDPSGLAFDISDNLYASMFGGYGIEKFDSSGNGSIFALTGASSTFIAMGTDIVPEPATLLFLSLGGLILRKRKF